MNNETVDCTRDHEDNRRPLLSSPEQEAAESARIAVTECDLSLVGIKLLLVGHRVGEFLHDCALEVFVPPKLEGAIATVEVAGPLVFGRVDFICLVGKVRAEEDYCDELGNFRYH